uniref:Isopenicillin N synthase-like Fe(2+) 2OG dioxygenase domain-containing protein n=1 Tax=Fagus sylvatica TaxID=28930 RepID=A0A2N9IE73_FAGSY
MVIQTKIPVLDFSSEDLKPGTGSWFSMCKEVSHALEEYGCFVVELGHKVSLQLHNNIFDAVGELFDFPIETKQKITYEKPVHGYVSSGLHERMVIDKATMPEETQKLTNIFWPNGNDRFREIANSFVKLMADLDKMVTRMIFENYGVEKYYDSHIESTTHTFAFLKYKEPQNTGTNTGLKNHTDNYFTSIIHQNSVKGLEIKTKHGEWIGFDPSPSTFVFLAADALQVYGFVFGAFEGVWVECHGWLLAWVLVSSVGCGCGCCGGSVAVDIGGCRGLKVTSDFAGVGES